MGSLAHSTANAGENAMARIRERAQAAGFGSNQPITFAAENQQANENAGRIAQIPLQVEQQVAPLEMQAANQYAGLGNDELSAARIYNPESYYGAGVGMENQRQQDYYRQLQEQRQKKGGIWGTLAKVGLNAASAAL